MLVLPGRQDPLTFTIDDEDGLPSEEVYQVVQDSFGYLWIGCDAGLFRYDGFEYRKYTAEGQSGRSISGLQLSADNSLWCKNFTGQIFHLMNDSLKLICDLRTKATSIVPFCVDSAGRVFVGLNDRVNIYNVSGDSIRAINLGGRGRNNVTPVRSLCINGNEIFCSVPELGIFYGTVNGTELQLIDSSAAEAGYSLLYDLYNYKQQVFCQVSDMRKGYYHFGFTDKDGFHLTKTVTRPHPFFRLLAVVPDDAGKLWFCTSHGVNYFSDLNEVEFDTTAFFLRSSKVTWTIEDREGSRWFSTLSEGLKCAPSLEVTRYNRANSGLTDEHLTAVSVLPDGNVVTGSYTGQICFLKEGKFVNIVSPQLKVPVFATKRIVSFNSGFICAHGATTVHDGNGKLLRLIPLSNARDIVTQGDSVYQMLPEGLFSFSQNDVAGSASLIPTRLLRGVGGRALCKGIDAHDIYASFNDGVFRYGNSGITPIEANGKPVFANALYCDGRTVWTAGINDGICGIVGNNVVKQYNTSNGLKDNEIRHISGNDDFLIAVSGEYVYKIDLHSDSVFLIGLTDGVNAKDINAITVQNGLVYLATGKGLVTFPTKLNSYNSSPPAIAFTSLYIDDKRFTEIEELNIPYGSSNIRIGFTSVALRARGKYNVRYHLLGADTAWVYVPASTRSITLSGLASGEYLLEAEAVNEDGVVSARRAKISIVVDAPVWQRWWFYLLSAAIAITFVVAIAVWRLRIIRRNENVKRQLILSQLTALKAQMNPHFMYNALNSIQDLVLQRDIRNSSAYLSKFSKLMRAVLSASDKQWTTVSEEIGILELYLELEKLRLGDQFAFSITAASEVQDLKIPSMIIQPYVENALKHGLLHSRDAKKLDIVFEANEQLKCRITDNGIGRVRSAEINRRQRGTHTSFANSANDKRLELLSQSGAEGYSVQITDLYDGDAPAGTAVELIFPVLSNDS